MSKRVDNFMANNKLPNGNPPSSGGMVNGRRVSQQPDAQ